MPKLRLRVASCLLILPPRDGRAFRRPGFRPRRGHEFVLVTEFIVSRPIILVALAKFNVHLNSFRRWLDNHSRLQVRRHLCPARA